MSELVSSVHVNVEYYDGQNADDDDHSYYVASFVEIAATTDGQTMDELIHNIHEVIDLYLETQTENMDVKLTTDPKVVITVELPHYAQIA
jgi:predicted RNase H-like HicB family nuclease